MNMMQNMSPGTGRAWVPGQAKLEAQMGEMLASAIRHGALLDERWWAPWIRGVEDGVSRNTMSTVDDLLVVEMYEPDAEGDGLYPHRRWFADPVTKLLIAQWWNAKRRLPPGTTPRQCLERHWKPRGHTIRVEVSERVALARSLWEFQLPGLLLEFAAGPAQLDDSQKVRLLYDRAPAASAPQETWERIAYGLGIPDRPREPRVKPAKQFDHRPIRSGEGDLLAILEKAPRRWERGKEHALGSKRRARDELGKLDVMADRVVEAMRLWCCHALRHEKGNQSSRGYSLTTVTRYLEALLWAFSRWLGESPATVSGRDITGHLMLMLERTSSGERSTLVNAIASFERFRDTTQRADRPQVPLIEYREADSASPDLVLPKVYSRARKIIETAGEHDLALALVLQYRAGLRPNEAFALRVGDVCYGAGRVELIVEANRERELKTKTSRRIIPLDVLLDPDELDLLESRIASRHREHHDDPEAWLLGHELSVSPTITANAAASVIDAALREAGGTDRLEQRHLRHSFASYLLATFLLPQDVAGRVVPDALVPVISPERRARVNDRFLGQERLGAGALHAVSQVMGHVGPAVTLRFYAHLLDLILGLYCSRPSSHLSLKRSWLDHKLQVSRDAYDKALGRMPIETLGDANTRDSYKGPSPKGMRAATPCMRQKQCETGLLKAKYTRESRNLKRRLEAELLQIEVPRRQTGHAAGAGQAGPTKTKRRPAAGLAVVVPLRLLCASVEGRPSTRIDASTANRWRSNAAHFLPHGKSLSCLRDAAMSKPALERFVEARLKLSNRLTNVERNALSAVVERWRAGMMNPRLPQLGTAQTLVGILAKMGFKEEEIELSLTSKHGRGLTSGHVHAFLKDTSTIPNLAGAKWSGSVGVSFQPCGLDNRNLTASACRFALLVLAIYSR